MPRTPPPLARMPSEKADAFVTAVAAGYRAAGLRGRGVLLAVSGGADSCALLRASAHAAPALALRLEVATLDHGLRAEAAGEAARVAELCARLGLPCHVRALGLADGPGLEARARTARYAALEAVRAARALDAVATAHTASDQAETLLMRLVRGASLSGAAGVRARRGTLVRPMLGLTRADVEAFLAEVGQAPLADDATNADPRFLRARVRHGVLPALAAAAQQPRARTEAALARFAALAAEDGALLDALAHAAHVRLRLPDGALDAVGLRALEPPLARRVLAEVLREAGLAVDGPGVERALAAVHAGGTATLPRGHQLRAAGGRVRALAPGAPRAALPLSLAPDTPRVATPTGWTLALVEGDARRDALHLPLAPSPSWPLRVRTRAAGDRVLLPSGHHRRLQDVLTDARVPAEARDALPVITDAAGTLLWVPGVWSRATPGPEPQAGALWHLTARPPASEG